jgi:hypothetical protein
VGALGVVVLTPQVPHAGALHFSLGRQLVTVKEPRRESDKDLLYDLCARRF